jgi:SAM-dependent methyltransferase
MKYDNLSLENVCCPFCKDTKGVLLYTVTASEAATHFILPWQNRDRYEQLKEHIRDLWNQNTCQVVCCKSCSGVFSWPFVAGDKIFYDLAYTRSGYPQEKWEYKRALEFLLKTVPTPKLSEINVLEIGAGNGAFIKKILAAGVNPGNISAIEYSDYGRKELETLNLKLISFESVPSEKLRSIWRGEFDFIFMFQVLEHLDELDGKLTFLRSCLRDKGQLICAVPNPEKIYFNELNGALLDMPPNHISRFSEASVQNLAARNLFELKDFEVQPLENTLEEFKVFCTYKYLKNSQSRYTLASLISRLPSIWKIRGAFQKLYFGLTLTFNAAYISKIRSGSSQLSVLQKV